LALARRRDFGQAVPAPECPTDSGGYLSDFNTRIECREHQLAGQRVYFENRLVGDDFGRARPGHTELPAGSTLDPMAGTGDEVHRLGEGAAIETADHYGPPRVDCDLCRTTTARQADR